MQKTFVIREAKIKDLPFILGLNLELFKKEYKEYDKTLNLAWTHKEGESYFKKRIIGKDGIVLVVENNKKIIGYLCGGISKREFYRGKGVYVELENMFIEKEFRRSGIGARLGKKFIKWCQNKKPNRISVKVSAQNKEAKKFYEKMGFREYDLILERKA